jgi:hypothetical protein
MLSSQKTINKETYPDDFTEDDKYRFDFLLEQSKILFPKIKKEWVLKMGILAFMKKEKLGMVETICYTLYIIPVYRDYKLYWI